MEQQDAGPGDGLALHFTSLRKTISVAKAQGGLLRSNIPDAGERKEILTDVSGSAHVGEILAIMGPSGSGKTSLLDVLAGRGSFQGGNVTVNGVPFSKGMKRQIAYVMQQDLFFGHLTVRDTLTYTALLRLPRELSRAEKEREVSGVIRRLRLDKCAHTPIMLISGGEKKRTNIGTELLTNPKIMMLDEPTSGLDSTSAVALITTLKSLAAEGTTVLTSIHQPSSAVFASFDSLLLLADGRVVFFGPPTASLRYFAEKGFPCPEGYNAADHCMDLLIIDRISPYYTARNNSGGNGDIERSGNGFTEEPIKAAGDDQIDGFRKARVETGTEVFGPTPKDILIASWDNGAFAAEVEKERSDCLAARQAGGGGDRELESGRRFEPTYWLQFTVLMHRSLKNGRSKLFTWINFIKSVLLGVLVGLVWFQMENKETYVQDKSGFTFFAMTYWVFDSMFNAMLAFPSEKAIVDKERGAGSYHLSAYFLAKMASEAPCRLLMPCIYIVISYWMAWVRPNAGAFFGFAAVELLGVLVGESIGLLIGASVPDFEKAMTAMTLISLGLMLTGGFFASNIPVFFEWIQYLSPFK